MKFSVTMLAASAVTAAAAAASEEHHHHHDHRFLRKSKAGKSSKGGKSSRYSKHSTLGRYGGSYSYSMSSTNSNSIRPGQSNIIHQMEHISVAPPKEPVVAALEPAEVKPSVEPEEEQLQEEEEDQIIIPPQLIGITELDTLNDPNSPQARALKWIMDEDAMGLDVKDEGWLQRYIMAAFYFATGGGDNWKECNAPKDNSQAAIDAANEKCSLEATQYKIGKLERVYGTKAWLSPVPVCEWASLACHDTDDSRKGTISQIEFESNGLVGKLIPELAYLSNLQFLILEKGKLSGSIPPGLGELPLIMLDLDYNELSGNIPDEIYDATTLQQIDLNNNKLTGTISPKIKQLKTLTFFQIDHNGMEGEIPKEMGDLKRLSIFTLTENNFIGVMPAEVCDNGLETLIADCEKVDCPCCTDCFEEDDA
ncbi:hypothetical protein ACHAWC_003131 [Mediolabrus comicus]